MRYLITVLLLAMSLSAHAQWSFYAKRPDRDAGVGIHTDDGFLLIKRATPGREWTYVLVWTFDIPVAEPRAGEDANKLFPARVELDATEGHFDTLLMCSPTHEKPNPNIMRLCDTVPEPEYTNDTVLMGLNDEDIQAMLNSTRITITNGSGTRSYGVPILSDFRGAMSFLPIRRQQ